MGSHHYSPTLEILREINGEDRKSQPLRGEAGMKTPHQL